VAGASQPAELSSSQVVAVHLSPEDYELYYNGCCNATLWPLFHSMPDRAVFDETFWLAYKAVNEKFARATLERLRQLEPVSVNHIKIILAGKATCRRHRTAHKNPVLGRVWPWLDTSVTIYEDDMSPFRMRL
jgi:hypothetical protein